MRQPVFSPDSLTIYFDSINRSKNKNLSNKDEYDLYQRIKKGDQVAEHKLITANLKFVVSVARNYQNQGILLEDLISIGNIGLIKAAKRFDASKNFRFISYAVWWIRQAILQALSNQSRITCIPLNQVTRIRDVRSTIENLTQKYHKVPNSQEVADELGLSIREVNEIYKMDESPVYLDQPLKDSKRVLADILRSEDDIEKEVLSSRSYKYILEALKCLPNRDKDVLLMYFGFNDHASTLEEIGIRMNLTRERVRQIKERSLKTLKKNENIKDLLKHFISG